MHRITSARQPRMLPASQSQLQHSGSAYPPGYLEHLAQSGGADAPLEYLLGEGDNEYLLPVGAQANYLIQPPPPQGQRYAQRPPRPSYSQEPYAQPTYAEQGYGQPTVHSPTVAPHHVMPPEVAELIAQMQQGGDLARGIGQTHQYEYEDADRRVRGFTSTKAWFVPGSPSLPPAPQSQFQPQPHSEKREGGYGVSAQMAGLIAMVTGLLIMLAMISLSLSHSQGVNDGLERANTTVRP